MIYLIAGQSATGKTTQANILNQDENFHKIISYTTRDKRKNEKDGIDYHFISEEKFKDLEKNNFFVAPVKYSGNYYGIAKKDLEKFHRNSKNIILVLELSGVKEIKSKFEDSISIYLDLNDDEMVDRMKARGDSPEKIKDRLENKQDFTGFADHTIDGSKSIEEISKEIRDIVGI